MITIIEIIHLCYLIFINTFKFLCQNLWEYLIIPVEINYLFFSTIIFFISLFCINFSDKTSSSRYNISFFYFVFLYFNIIIYSTNAPLYYDFSVFSGNIASFLIKNSLLFITFIFYLFLIISYRDYFKPEIFYFFNLSVSSALFIATTSDFIITFLLLELSSMPIYALIALPKNRFAIEAAVKYLIFGSLASQLFIISYIFYSYLIGSNTINDLKFFYIFNETANFSVDVENVFSIFFFISIFIKFGVGPFYNWLIDVYQASSFPMFVYNSTISKLIVAVPLVTIGSQIFVTPMQGFVFTGLLVYSSFHSVVNMFFQSNIRRVFGYSSVINFSFLMLILFFMSGPSGAYIFYKYLIFYNLILFFSYGIFNIYKIGYSERQEPQTIEDFTKNNSRNLSLIMSSAIIFSSGLPPFGIFYAKAYVYGAIISNASTFGYIVVTFLLLNSIIALFGYFRMLAKIYSFKSPVRKYPTQFNEETYHLVVLNSMLFFLILAISYNWNFYITI